MNIGSLFSGIGGLELGLEWSGLGPTVWQVEMNPFCRAVLAKHWPHAERFEDVKAVGKCELTPVDLICGGFPCQDVSSAGKRVGLTGARSGLWFEYLRIVRELRPQWVVVENVASGARDWLDIVVAGLGEQGYACLPVPLAAADVGAPHRRDRVFIVAAHADAKGQSPGAKHAEMAGASAFTDPDAERRKGGGAWGRESQMAADPRVCHWRSAQPDMVRVVSRFPGRLDSARRRIAALGNSVVPQCAEVIGNIIQELTRADT
jgi:DNA (cytosine-5)-methyltransferase 1